MADSEILYSLNANQRSAVTSPAGVLQVLAPPGSGKTKTLTARIAYLVAHRQLQPCNIIVCTFTVKAASEMSERIRSLLGDDVARQLKLGTFHSVALRYLRHYGQHIGLPTDFGIADSSDSKAILKRIIKRLELSIEPAQALGIISSRKAKGDALPPVSKTAQNMDKQRLFEEYEAALAASKLLDYDDILLRCSSLLKTHPRVVSNVAAVLIDEFQDTNSIQYELMKLFAQQRNVITIVGDPDQSIYGFRSADIKNLARMKADWPDTLTINLEENYRSSAAILHAAQNIIEQDGDRPQKSLRATHGFGMRPVLRKLASPSMEAEWLVAEIHRMQACSGHMVQLGDFAVLLRSAALSRVIETALGNAGISYRMVGGARFYERVEIRLILDYLRVLHQPDNNEAVQRIVNVPSRRIGEETIKRLLEEAEETGTSLWTLILNIVRRRRPSKLKLSAAALKGLELFTGVILAGLQKIETWECEQPSLVDLVDLIVNKVSLQAYLKTKHTNDETFEARWSNVDELRAQAADMTTPERLDQFIQADELPSVENFEQKSRTSHNVLSIFLENIALTSSAEKSENDPELEKQQVTISTIHAAKGLEWPIVFIPACYNGSIPHSRSDDSAEERRLLYVGMTRAQALLYLSCPMQNAQRDDTTISPFLTHSGATEYFDEHGPSLPLKNIASLADTLKRCCPAETVISDSKKILSRDEDDCWPLNGERIAQERFSWPRNNSDDPRRDYEDAETTARARPLNTAKMHTDSISTFSTALQPGFTSAAARYTELREEAAKSASLKERVNDRPDLRIKRPLSGNVGDISNYFSKRMKGASDAAPAALRSESRAEPLRTQSTTAHAQPSFRRPTTKPTHPILSTPIASKPFAPLEDQENAARYVFISSPPAEPEQQRDKPDMEKPCDSDRQPAPQTRPATSLHATTSQVVLQRKTLGVRRSLHGWSARGRG